MSGAVFTPLRFDSRDLPEEERYRTFASAMVNFDMRRGGSGPFDARALIWRVGSLVVTQVSADPVRYDRPLSRVRTDRVDHVYLNYHISGSVRAECGRGVVRGGAGSLLAIDMRRPCRLDVDAMQEISVAVPRHLFLPRLQPFGAHGLLATGGMAELFGATLQTVCASLPKLETARGEALQAMILDLAAEVLLDAARRTEAVATRTEALVSRVRSFMDEHLSEPLGVAEICAGVGASRSSLYRAFGGGGGVLRQLQRRRLRRACALLEDAGETRSIAALAEATGFADKSHFARVFKQAYGMTPGQFRSAPTTGGERGPPADHDVALAFGNLVSALD